MEQVSLGDALMALSSIMDQYIAAHNRVYLRQPTLNDLANALRKGPEDFENSYAYALEIADNLSNYMAILQEGASRAREHGRSAEAADWVLLATFTDTLRRAVEILRDNQLMCVVVAERRKAWSEAEFNAAEHRYRAAVAQYHVVGQTINGIVMRHGVRALGFGPSGDPRQPAEKPAPPGHSATESWPLTGVPIRAWGPPRSDLVLTAVPLVDGLPLTFEQYRANLATRVAWASKQIDEMPLEDLRETAEHIAGPLPKAMLQNANRWKTVDLMLRTEAVQAALRAAGLNTLMIPLHPDSAEAAVREVATTGASAWMLQLKHYIDNSR